MLQHASPELSAMDLESFDLLRQPDSKLRIFKHEATM